VKYLVIISEIIFSFLVSTVIDPFVSFFLKDLNIGLDHSETKFAFIIVNWLLWFVIINGLQKLIRSRLDNKKILDWAQICLVSLILIINATYLLLKKHTAECQAAKYELISDEVSDSLKKIPVNRIFYYYQGNKIPLWRSVDKCGKPFFHTGDKNNRIIINNQLSLKFSNQVTNEEIIKILERENLQTNKQYTDYDLKDNRFNLLTTPKSKYNNAIQMSDYLAEYYKKEIEYAEPDMLHSLSFGRNILDNLQSTWLKTIYFLTTGCEPLSVTVPF
jgi:hypothetical protein